jgi:hypothetical protein
MCNFMSHPGDDGWLRQPHRFLHHYSRISGGINPEGAMAEVKRGEEGKVATRRLELLRDARLAGLWALFSVLAGPCGVEETGWVRQRGRIGVTGGFEPPGPTQPGNKEARQAARSSGVLTGAWQL